MRLTCSGLRFLALHSLVCGQLLPQQEVDVSTQTLISKILITLIYLAFGFYAGLNVLAFIMILFLLPGKAIRHFPNHSFFLHHLAETKQRTLEELDYVFAVPMRKHVSYQLTEFIPYWIRRHVFWNKNVELKPLYNFDEVESITVFEKGVGH